MSSNGITTQIAVINDQPLRRAFAAVMDAPTPALLARLLVVLQGRVPEETAGRNNQGFFYALVSVTLLRARLRQFQRDGITAQNHQQWLTADDSQRLEAYVETGGSRLPTDINRQVLLFFPTVVDQVLAQLKRFEQELWSAGWDVSRSVLKEFEALIKKSLQPMLSKAVQAVPLNEAWHSGFAASLAAFQERMGWTVQGSTLVWMIDRCNSVLESMLAPPAGVPDLLVEPGVPESEAAFAGTVAEPERVKEGTLVVAQVCQPACERRAFLEGVLVAVMNYMNACIRAVPIEQAVSSCRAQIELAVQFIGFLNQKMSANGNLSKPVPLSYLIFKGDLGAVTRPALPCMVAAGPNCWR